MGKVSYTFHIGFFPQTHGPEKQRVLALISLPEAFILLSLQKKGVDGETIKSPTVTTKVLIQLLGSCSRLHLAISRNIGESNVGYICTQVSPLC